MAILTPSEKNLYFPDCPISGTGLVAAIARAQMTAESAKGCNRPLELQAFTEVRRLNRSLHSCQLTRFPIALTPTPIVEARCGGFKDGFGRSHPVTPWQTLTAEQYTLDYETGQLHLLASSELGFVGLIFSEVRSTYTSGFDFSLATPKVLEIKAAVAAILIYQTLGVG